MSSNRWNLREFIAGIPDTQDAIDRVRDEVSDLLDTWGLDPAYVGAGPQDLGESQGAYRYQYTAEYIFSRGRGGRGWRGRDSGYPVQFKTILYTTSPITPEMERYLREVHNGRLRTLFNTGPYDGYMDGFAFWDRTTDIERDTVVPAEKVPDTGIGIPRWEVEVYFGDNPAGMANGYSMDFHVEEHEEQAPTAPQQEVWRVVGYGQRRDDYEIGPKPRTPARDRAKAARGKGAYIAGKYIGDVTTRGTVWMPKHESPQSSKTSREEILAETPIPYQRLSKGARLWKVAEDVNSVYLAAEPPVDFDAVDPQTVDPSETGTREVTQQLADPSETATTFVVQQDENINGALGRYDPPVERRIAVETAFEEHLQY